MSESTNLKSATQQQEENTANTQAIDNTSTLLYRTPNTTQQNETNRDNSSDHSPGFSFNMENIAQLGGLAVCLGISLLLAVILGFMSATTTPAGHVGVVKAFGEVQADYLNPGLSWVNPISDSVTFIDVRIQSVTYSSLAFSKDLQNVETSAALQYSISPALMPKAFSEIGSREMIESSIIQKGIAEGLKAVTSQFSAKDLIAKRSQVKMGIRKEIEEYVSQTTSEKGLTGLVKIANLAITDFKFSQEFNRAIENKVRAEQEALQAENELNKTVTQAKAQQQQKKIAADAEAYKITTMAEAEANKMKTLAAARAQAIKQESMALKNNPQLIDLRAVEKWDGALPQITGGGALPFLNVDSLKNNENSRNRRSAKFIEDRQALENFRDL